MKDEQSKHCLMGSYVQPMLRVCSCSNISMRSEKLFSTHTRIPLGVEILHRQVTEKCRPKSKTSSIIRYEREAQTCDCFAWICVDSPSSSTIAKEIVKSAQNAHRRTQIPQATYSTATSKHALKNCMAFNNY